MSNATGLVLAAKAMDAVLHNDDQKAMQFIKAAAAIMDVSAILSLLYSQEEPGLYAQASNGKPNNPDPSLAYLTLPSVDPIISPTDNNFANNLFGSDVGDDFYPDLLESESTTNNPKTVLLSVDPTLPDINVLYSVDEEQDGFIDVDQDT